MPNEIAGSTSAALTSVSGGAANQNNTNRTLSETTEVSGTTVFVNDANEKTQEARPSNLDASLAVSKTDDNSIALFMAKPVSIDSINWTSAANRNSVLAGYSIADYVIGGATPTIWKNKLSGYNLIRGTAVLKFVINAQPFQAGRLLVHFLPNHNKFAGYNFAYDRQHNYNLTTKTQQPCVEIDILDGTGTIEIPYIAPALWLSRTDPYDWGRVFVTVLSPLASASATSVYINTYMYFKDFELAAPIFGPEMGLGDAITKTANNVKDAVVDLWNTTKNERSATKESGVVTTFFDFVAKPLKALSGIPLIGESTGLMAGIAHSFGDLASYLGWSRPYDIKGTQIVKQHNMYRGFNFNGTTTADVLAMDSLNQVLPMSGYAGSTVDEMSFNYLKSIPALIKTFAWTTADDPNTNLYSQTLAPFDIASRDVVSFGGSSGTSLTMPPFAYLSRYFRYYRGGIVLTIKLVKTQFHSGRLVVTFTPSTINFPTDAEGRAYVYREIIDVRTSDTFSFTLPYMHPAPFLNTGWSNALNLDDVSFGTFRIEVLNPLIAASTVSSSIDALVYANAAEDFQLSALQSTSSYSFTPEMNTDVPRVSGPIGDAPAGNNSISPTALCTGEIFLSVKQLFSMLRPVHTFGKWGARDATTACVQLYPYYPALPSPSSGAVPTFTTTNFAFDYVSEVSSGYVYTRGGMRMSSGEASSSSQSSIAWLNQEGTGTYSITPGEEPFSQGGPFITTASAFSKMPPIAIRNTSSTIFDTIVPHYGQTPFRLNYVNTPNFQTIPTSYDSPDYVLNVLAPRAETDKVIGAAFYRSGADDYAAGYFIGFPPVFNL